MSSNQCSTYCATSSHFVKALFQFSPLFFATRLYTCIQGKTLGAYGLTHMTLNSQRYIANRYKGKKLKQSTKETKKKSNKKASVDKGRLFQEHVI
ncbi:MAG: hypothetical protein AAFZ17_13415 [Cyanobacteria bacterium J06650_10]